MWRKRHHLYRIPGLIAMPFPFLFVEQINKKHLIPKPGPSSSGGNWLTSLAVATTKTNADFYRIQERNAPMILAAVPRAVLSVVT